MTRGLRVDRLEKVFKLPRRPPKSALRGVSFEVASGEVVGLLGPNGAGKTTLIKCISTLILPSSGFVRIDEIDVHRSSRKALQHVASVLEGNRNILWRLTARENLEFFAGLQGISRRRARPRVAEILERFGLGDTERVPALALSRGMQQRLSLGCALVKDTEILLLDEPTLGLDLESSEELIGFLRELSDRGDRIMIVSGHDMKVIQRLCRRAIVIDDGRVVADDSMERLIAHFRSEEYEVVLRRPPGERAYALLQSELGGCPAAEGPEATRLRVRIREGKGFYDTVDALRVAGLDVESIRAHEPSLEEVFLNLIGRR